jgi:hypothetical protein
MSWYIKSAVNEFSKPVIIYIKKVLMYQPAHFVSRNFGGSIQVGNMSFDGDYEPLAETGGSGLRGNRMMTVEPALFWDVTSIVP